MYHAEIRDRFGDVESATIADRPIEVFKWYREHGVDMADVELCPITGGYTFTRK